MLVASKAEQDRSTDLQLCLQAVEEGSVKVSGSSSGERNFSRELWPQQDGALSPWKLAVRWNLYSRTAIPGLNAGAQS